MQLRIAFRQELAIEIEPTETAKWKKCIGRMRSLKIWIFENLELVSKKQAKYFNLHQRERVCDQVIET